MKFSRYYRKMWDSNKSGNIHYKTVTTLESFLDIPEDTGEGIFIIKSGRFYKWVIFKCPNGCGKKIEVNLMKVRIPKWKLQFIKNKVTLYPSVVVEECGAHFWLYKNQIEWATFENVGVSDELK